ncbi:MAG: aspartate 1-decarboxylase [Planctomycetes bacterium]|nr:aspartate 1-decarboxylase [Planctomycetota bacterium]
MFREMLKCKIHRATVTDACLDYEGSLSVCPKLLAKAGLLPGEKVLVANLTNGNRFETYIIEGKEGEICINGAAAHLGEVGNKVIVICFALYSEEDMKNYKPTIVHVNAHNEEVE